MPEPLPPFPEGFVGGVSTSADQIEGAVTTDRRRSSTWDTYSHTPGKVRIELTGQGEH